MATQFRGYISIICTYENTKINKTEQTGLLTIYKKVMSYHHLSGLTNKPTTVHFYVAQTTEEAK